jgi:hypothetical protein
VVDASELPLDGAVATLLDRFPLSDARDATDAVEEAP